MSERFSKPPIEQIPKTREAASRLERLDARHAEEILKETEIHGSQFEGETLTVDEIRKAGLEPRFFKKARGVDVYLSSPYQFDDAGRLAVVGYLKSQREGTVNVHPVVRTFYTSGSQATWRYLPDYQVTEDGDITWYGKGHHETSLQLPLELQETLAHIEATSSARPKPTEAKKLFAGTAKSILDVAKEYKDKERLTYYGSVNAHGAILSGRYSPEMGEKMAPPERAIFQEGIKWPDFSKPAECAWSRESPLYGKIEMEVFPSKDDTLRYLFCRDEQNRAWIASVEWKDAKLTSAGLPKDWINAGNITTPLGEYAQQAGKYGGAYLPNGKGRYVDMFDNYLSKMTYIKQYLYVNAKKEEQKSKSPGSEKDFLYAMKMPAGKLFAEGMPKMSLEQISAAAQSFKTLPLADGRELGEINLPVLIDLIKQGRASVDFVPEDYGLRKRLRELLMRK